MNSLSSRLLTTTAIALTCISGVVVLALAVLLRWGPDMLINFDLDHNAARVVAGVHFNAAGVPDGVRLNQKMTAIYSVLLQDAVYRVVDQNGVALLSSDHAAAAYAPAGERFDPQRTRFRVVSNGEGQQVVTVPFTHDTHDGRTFYVQLMRSERMQRIMLGSDSEKAQKIAIAAAVVAMLLFSLIVVATLHRALKPLRKASAAAGQIQIDNLSARLSLEDVPSELAPLFNAFNLALQRLEDGYRVQREFLATAAHELKTPLALMRGQIELDERGDRSALLRDLDHMARQVHQLLHLAEASERQNYAMEEIDLKDIAAEASAQLERLAQQRAVRIVGVANDEPVMISADRGALFVLMRNLIENAVHHAPPGSAVDVDVSMRGVAVRDYGDGIPAEAMPQLFKRFWRGAHRRDEGAGLGLSICEEIVHAHGWTLHAENAGPGARFRIGFQAAAA